MSTKDIFENLVTDITTQVLEKVQQQVQALVVGAVASRIENLITTNQVNTLINNKISDMIVNYRPDMSVIDQNMSAVITEMGKVISSDLTSRINRTVGEKVGEIDLSGMAMHQIIQRLESGKTKYHFPNESIDIASVNLANLVISGNSIVGGVITNFGSTGIDDKATECKVTILDQGTVFENTLYAPRVEVKGGALIDGDLDIQGRFVDSPAYQQLVADVATSTQATITTDILKEHQTLIFEKIKNDGIDLNKVTFNGRVLINDDRLVGVVNSQLRTVGILEDLQTSGESLLSETLYTSNKRVGVNTMDPKTALSVWDEEVEISVGKSQKNVGRIAAERENCLVLGSNNKDNITLSPDGSTSIPVLRLNNMTFTTASAPPSHDARIGTVVFNENPSLGGPLGWVSLGSARWANFGIID